MGIASLLKVLLWSVLHIRIDVGSSSLQSVYYQSWLELLNTNAGSEVRWHNTTAETMLKDASNADDLFQRISLPFAFPFVGVDRFVAFVGSNGYVQFDSTNSPPCISQISNNNDPNIFVCFQSSFSYSGKVYSNDFNNSYLGMLSVFTADLYPAWAYPKSAISWSSKNSSSTSGVDTAFIHYRDVPFYNFSMSRINNTFHVKLRNDGAATFFYEDVNYQACFKNSPKLCFGAFVVGLRDTYGQSAASYLSQSKEQALVQSRVWNTLVKGVYPPSKTLVKSQTMFHLCPFSDSWCMTPRIAMLGSTSTPLYLNLSTLSASCEDSFSAYLCTFTRNTASTVLTNAAELVIGSAPPFTYRCLVPTAVLSTAGNWTVDLLGTVIKTVATSTFISGDSYSSNPTPVSSLDISLLPQDASSTLTLRVLSGSLSATQKTACGATSPLQQAIASSTSQTCTVNECSACSSSGIACLVKTLPCNSIASLKMCDGTCHSPGVSSNIKLYQSLFWEKLGTCCDAALIDCSGNCRGSKVVAPRFVVDELGRRSNVCCTGALDCLGFCGSKAPKLDCNKDCAGKASVDGCGVCSGGKTGKSASRCDLKYKFSDNLLNVSIPYVANLDWVRNKSGLAVRNLTLTNTASVKFSVITTLPQNDPLLDPAVNFAGSKSTQKLKYLMFNMQPNASVTIPVAISMERIFRGKTDKWAEKQIKLEYAPDSSTYKKMTQGFLDVFVVVPNCANITLQRVCMSAPMCMWCLSSSKRQKPQGSVGPARSAARMLFNIIAPPAVTPVFETADDKGFCSSGYDPTIACQPYMNDSDDDSGILSDPLIRSLIIVSGLMLAPVVVLLYVAMLSPWSRHF